MMEATADRDESGAVIGDPDTETTDLDPDLMDQATIPTPFLLTPPTEDSGDPTVAEREQSGPQTPDTSREAISQAATHIATPEQALTAKDATIAVGDPSASAGLQQTGDSLMEGMVIALGGVVIVAFSLLLYHFRKE